MTSKQCSQCTSFVIWMNATVDKCNSECCLQCVQQDLVLLSCMCSCMALALAVSGKCHLQVKILAIT